MRKKIEFNKLVHVHSIPEWLIPHLRDSSSNYYIWAKDYERVTLGSNLWRVFTIDENSSYWVEINYINEQGNPIFNSLKLEPNTYALIETDPYEIFDESSV